LPGFFPSSSHRARSAIVLSEAPLPSSQVTFSASRPLKAAHVESATTAQPRVIAWTERTPATFRAAASSKRTIFPPNTGESATAAYSIPGTWMSMP
jgi:hypothetical protein